MTGDVPAADDLKPRLEHFLRDALGARQVDVQNLTRASYGFSRENWPFDLVWEDNTGQAHQEHLILRRDPIGSVLETDRRIEFEILSALKEEGSVPVPEVRWGDVDGATFDRPSLIMTRHAGYADPFVLNGGVSQLPEPARIDLAKHFMSLVAVIHSVDWHKRIAQTLPVPPPGEAARVELDHWENELRRQMVEPLPELEFVLAWLRAKTPRSREVVLVHGDFKPGNTLIKDGKVVAVLDWETVHLGDPLEDLGWVTNPRRATEHQIQGLWERRQMMACYTEMTGREVDEESLRWWNVFSNFKLATIALTGVRSFIEERADRVFGSSIYALDIMLQQIGA